MIVTGRPSARSWLDLYQPRHREGEAMRERAQGATLVRFDRDPPLTRTMVRSIGREFTTDDSAARRDIGYVGRISWTEGLATYHL